MKEYFSLPTETPAFGNGGVTITHQPVFFLGVLLGALSKVIYDHFMGTTPFEWGHLVPAIIASFVTFPLIYKFAGLWRVSRLTLAKWCVAFQYGFFWQIVIREVERRMSGA